METKIGNHWSDCATHNEPAYPNGPCDCDTNAPSQKETMTHVGVAVILAAVYEQGTMNALEGYISLKRLEADVATAIAKLKDKATEEAAAYGKGEHEAYGAVIQHRASAGRWDFSTLPWRKSLDETQASLDMTRKSKEDMAKAAYNAAQKMQALPVDVETGEVIQPAQYTPGKDVVAIMLKKTK